MNSSDNIGINKNHKDRLFRLLLTDKENLLSLYNALNGAEYKNPEDLIITTLEDVIYMKLKNDISFMIDSNINLFEHQSTYNPNMPVRGLLYIADLYRQLLIEDNLFGTKLVYIPTPAYIVFYNGDKELGDKVILRLSDAYEVVTEHKNLELEVTMVNINYGHNKELMDKCEVLRGYSILIKKIKTYSKEKGLKEAVTQAINECIREGVLEDFLKRRRGEVEEVILTEYDEKKVMEGFRKEGWEDGRLEGRKEGHIEGRREGHIEGRREERIEVAKNLLGILEPEVIAQKIGLPLETVLELKQQEQQQ